MLLQLEEQDLMLLESAGVDDEELEEEGSQSDNNNNSNKPYGIQRVSLKDRIRIINS